MTPRRLFFKRALLCTATWVTVAGASLGCGTAWAQQASNPKIAADLRSFVQASASFSAPAGVTWAKKLVGIAYVKVLINASSSDAQLSALRLDILARGGSVLYNYLSVRALSAMVPVAALDALAARTDVIGISPNRATARHASLLQEGSGAGAALLALPGGSTLDGRGVGIAILDSGIDFRHKNFQNGNGQSRVRAAVDFVALGRAVGGDAQGHPKLPRGLPCRLKPHPSITNGSSPRPSAAECYTR